MRPWRLNHYCLYLIRSEPWPYRLLQTPQLDIAQLDRRGEFCEHRGNRESSCPKRRQPIILFLRFRGDNDAAMSMMDDGAEQFSVVTSSSLLGPRTKEITIWFKEESPNPRIHHINLHRREMRNPPPSRFFIFSYQRTNISFAKTSVFLGMHYTFILKSFND